MTLDNRHHLVVAPGRPSLFTLDFNLAATNSVDLTTTPATVTVTPALVASLDLVDQKDLRVRGPLVSVDTTAGTYVVDVRPFNMRNRAVRPGDGAHRREHRLRGQRHQLHRQRRPRRADRRGRGHGHRGASAP